MAIPTAIAKYKSVQVTTSSPGELLLMLFDGLFRFLGEARDAMVAKDATRTGERISRAHAILEELASSLDSRHAPELCDNLRGIYTFCMGHLVQANVRRDQALIEQVIKILTPVRDGFREVVQAATKVK
jgi:flagellar protein FliS